MSINEHELEILAISRVQPFSYVHESRDFHFGDEVVAVTDIPEHGSPHKGGGDLTNEDVRKLLQTTPYVYSYAHPISFPSSRDFIEQGWTDGIVQETRDVMADVFLENSEAFDVTERERLMKLRSFDLVRRTNPYDVIVNTLGACACLGPDYTTHHSNDELGIMEHTFHNMDRFEQRLSVMAGLGHVARRATEWLAGTARQ